MRNLSCRAGPGRPLALCGRTAALAGSPRIHAAGLTSGSHFPGVVCEQGDLDPVVERKLFEYPGDVRFDGRDAHVEFAADLGVGFAEPDRDGNLAFALAEAVELVAGAALAVAGGAVGEVADQPAGDRGESIGSPAAMTRTARTTSLGGVSLRRNPLAPARRARST
jgi:hypothetical protein